ncbi:MAG: Glu/Leu/Phe/Val dehydrogenase dimerization domain-containing protein [Bacteroidia bacterium]|jgi:glutamate dehydrogenase/leucine dehydrogenase|tara:strand:- start:1381 stop:2661 length:1281 start_codon:yes stop_codon:yes gene_type:complete
MEELLKKFENKRPEIVFEWKDSETEAEGWVVINSLRNGAAGGGTRMRKGLDKREVESLAKTMEVKFTIAGPPIGGAKSGINFDPADPRKEGVLRRWYAAVMPMLRNYYGTGGDMNVDQYSEVIPYTADLGVLHPQEGVVQGYYKNYSKVEKLQAITRLQSGVLLPIIDERFTPDVSKKYNVSDMITGWGVSEGVRHYYELWGGTMNHKTAIIQGWGNVSAAAAFYLAKHGVKIVGIIDREGGLINKEGYSLAEVTDMFINRDGNKLNANTPGFAPFAEVNAQIWELGAEIFIPGAGSRLVTKNQVTSLIDGQCEVISCGANVPFADPEIFLGEISMYADANIAVVPDFIANCGMARTFGFLMSEKGEVDDVAILKDASDIIGNMMARLHQFNPKTTGLSRKALEMSLTDLVDTEDSSHRSGLGGMA